MPQTTETALPFQVNFEDDDDDHNGKVAKFNELIFPIKVKPFRKKTT